MGLHSQPATSSNTDEREGEMQAVGAHGNENGSEEKPRRCESGEAAAFSLLALQQLCGWREPEAEPAGGTGFG